MSTLPVPRPDFESRSHRTTLHRRWDQLCEELEHPAVELTLEEFAPVLSTFRALQEAGEHFDRGFVAIMLVLERQAFHADDDHDASDSNIDCQDHTPASVATQPIIRYGEAGAAMSISDWPPPKPADVSSPVKISEGKKAQRANGRKVAEPRRLSEPSEIGGRR